MDTDAPTSASADDEMTQVVDAPLAAWRRDLLKLAFRAASSFPSHPHRKNRGRAQTRAVEAAFALQQPQLALRWAPKVESWWRGLAYADYAWLCAQAGRVQDCKQFVALAQVVIDEQRADPNAQQWRADKVQLKIARAMQAAGQPQEAQQRIAALDATSSGAADQAWTDTIVSTVAMLDDARARAEVDRLADGFHDMPFGEQVTALAVLGSLHGRFFADTALRVRIEELVTERFVKVPSAPILDVMAAMAGAYIDAADTEGARAMVGKMEALIAARQWQERHRIPEQARVVTLYARLGDVERARAELTKLVGDYHLKRESMLDIDRAAALRPVALAAYAIGDREQADGLLLLALEEGVENPNSRPRCNDLVAMCVALAKHDVQPAKELWGRMRELADGLGDPW